jgi:hypothetical protein
MELSFVQTSGFAWSTDYVYFVRAVNTLGVGVLSTGLTLTTPVNPSSLRLPSFMTAPVLQSKSAFWIYVSWVELTNLNKNGGETPIFY